MTDMPAPRPTHGTVHQHSWQPAGLTRGASGDSTVAMCSCGATRRFAVPEQVTLVDDNGREHVAPDTLTALAEQAHRRR